MPLRTASMELSHRTIWFQTGDSLVHQTFMPGLDSPQVAESRRRYAGSNKPISVERNSIGKEELLEPLPLLE
jgi:hypothetical protein